VLDDSTEAGQTAVAASVDHVVLTGGVETGRTVLAALAPRLVPATMELSGSDPCLVLDGADVEAAATAIAYGLALNGGATCIAPRCVIVTAARRPALVAALSSRLAAAPARPLPPSQASIVRGLLADTPGAVLGDAGSLAADAMRPLIICDPAPEKAAVENVFAPVAFLLEAADADEAVGLANESAYTLGASIFGAAGDAARCARRLRAGCITINDMIVPTADPNVPFGGAGQSGFGTTRGADGLLALTRPRAILSRKRPTTRHLRPVSDNALPLLRRILRLLYG
jgi:aldehyde dehydrogenase (NAD+)